MARKADKKLAASPLLQVTVGKKKAPPIPISVTALQLASLWALLSAAILVGSFSFALACTLVLQLHFHPPSWMLPRAGLTDEVAIGAMLCSVVQAAAAAMWCNAAQAAAGALALLLRGRRCRRALAYVALAATATGHVMCARVVALFVTADPGCIFFFGIVGAIDISFFAAGDLLCFMALLAWEE